MACDVSPVAMFISIFKNSETKQFDTSDINTIRADMNFVETLPSEETKLKFVSVEEELLLACIHLWASSSTGRALPAVCKFGEDGAPLSISTLAVPHIKAEQAFKEGAGSRAFLQRSTRVWSLPPTVQPTNSAGSSLKEKKTFSVLMLC